jgi:hypothetical protein
MAVVPPKKAGSTPRVGSQTSSEGYDAFKSDLGPWIETPNSTRVQRYRYDYYNRALQLQWTNNKNHGYIYEDMDYEGYRGFARAVSKGVRVNSHLNSFSYRLMNPDEVDAPSNSRYRQGVSRAIDSGGRTS